MSVLHLWLGLMSSIIVFIVCLTGSIYAFKTQIENAINSKIVYTKEESKPTTSIDSILKNFNTKFGEANQINIPISNNTNIFITNRTRKSNGVTVYYNRYSGKLVGQKNNASERFFDIVLELHRFLLMDEIGKLINGSAILIFVFLLFSGFILWIPRKIKYLKKSLSIKLNSKFYRLNYDFHKILGFYSILFLFLISVTGLYISFHWVKNTIIISLGGDSIILGENNTALKNTLNISFHQALNELSTVNAVISNREASVDSLIDITNNKLPYSSDLKIQLPNATVNKIIISKTFSSKTFYSPDFLEFSSNGNLIKQKLFNDLQLHEKFKIIATPLHTGELAGLPTIILYAIVSFIGCSLPVTGFIIWIKKSK